MSPCRELQETRRPDHGVGATGGVAGEVVRQIPEAAHEVTAAVRDPAAPVVTRERPELVRAGPGGPLPLCPPVAGRAAVLSGLGVRGRGTGGPVARPACAVVSARVAEGTRRPVVVSAAPVVRALGRAADRPDLPPPRPHGPRRGPRGTSRVRGAAGPRCGTDWTAARPPRPAHGPPTGTYRRVTGGDPRGGRSLSPAGTAHAVLGALGHRGASRQVLRAAH
ncbi:NAD(P)H-binding protein [Streptomyces sp. DSM 41037]|uniref:NAD(P)H-binding protein n=1 Tax=Streptomyces sp. DSM 41037 TaxID=2817710 RepID=UPI0027D8A3DC|nr:NAD(P)H-binding protein [Streptomyces sp. DSM 41037]